MRGGIGGGWVVRQMGLEVVKTHMDTLFRVAMRPRSINYS